MVVLLAAATAAAVPDAGSQPLVMVRRWWCRYR